tara:strand:- start:973 stop:1194 length:222 start_codon:yes stop_codon:yes gene_type:complete
MDLELNYEQSRPSRTYCAKLDHQAFSGSFNLRLFGQFGKGRRKWQLKDLGKKWFAFSKIDKSSVENILKYFRK